MSPNAPGVGVVIATHNRPALMRRALTSVLDQEYDGPIEVALVFDRNEPDDDLARETPGRSVKVLRNERTPGLAGARNTGVLSLDTELIAFCDDDDVWLPGKLSTQLRRFAAEPASEFVTTAMRVRYDERATVRLAHKDHVTIADLARSRMAALHPSSFVFRREAMLHGFGLVDETIPNSMAEDWDLLIRAARRRPIQHIDEPLVDVQWGQSSYFNQAWADKNLAHEWLINHHPEFRADRRGIGILLGKLAFGHAALGHRSAALGWARKAARANWREPRTVIALLVTAGLPAGWVVEQLNRRGHGI